jgi:hypothetical protein
LPPQIKAELANDNTRPKKSSATLFGNLVIARRTTLTASVVTLLNAGLLMPNQLHR